jgi:hypothetical protein
MMDMQFPNQDLIKNTMLDLRYEIDIVGQPADIYPWLKQLGYHRGGWYIDTWWDEFEQKYFWPYVVPDEARGTFKHPANKILPEYQDLAIGDIVPDGPPDSAYYEVVALEENHLLQLYATTHFNYIAPQFVYKTKYAPRGAFCWAFILQQLDEQTTRLVSWWRSEGYPRTAFYLLKPLISVIDSAHQRAILRGIKKRVEG